MQAAFNDCENEIEGAAAIIEYAGDEIACGNDPWSASVNLINLGNETISTADFK